MSTKLEVQSMYPRMGGGDAEHFLETVREAKRSRYILASGEQDM
jgi:hypothetical protein